MKEKSIKYYKKFLDDVFSLFIRLRDSNNEGIGFCITCNTPKHFTEADNGHYIKRQYLSTRYNEMNCNLQCKRCNAFEQGANEIYQKKLIHLYSKDKLLSLEAMKNSKSKYDRFTYKILIKEYQDKIIDLMKTKDFELSDYYRRLLK